MLSKKRLTVLTGAAVAALCIATQPILARQLDPLPMANGYSSYASADIPAGQSRIDVGALDPAPVPAMRPVPKSGKGSNYSVFGSVVVPVGTLPATKKWNGIASGDFLGQYGADCPATRCASGVRKTLAEAARRAEDLPPLEALALVNRSVNGAIAYASDKSAWGKGDYWASPVEIAKRGKGDCEDYAIAKMWLLRSIGFTPGQLQLVVLKDVRKQVFHAVLAVHVEGKAYVLDNMSNKVATDGAYASYVPILSFASGKSFIHGFTGKRSGLAQLGGDLSSVMPGEDL